MKLTDKQKELIFSEENIAKMAKNKELRQNVQKTMNDIVGRYLSQFGVPFPPLKSGKPRLVIRDKVVGKEKDASGAYHQRPYLLKGVRERSISMYAPNLPDNLLYLHIALHEPNHLLQDFFIKNKDKIFDHDLNLQEYTQMCKNFFNCKDVAVTEEMLKQFKYFAKSMRKELELAEKHIGFIGKFSYNNRFHEIMAESMALRALNDIVKTATPQELKSCELQGFINKKRDRMHSGRPDSDTQSKLSPEEIELIHTTIDNTFETLIEIEANRLEIIKANETPELQNQPNTKDSEVVMEVFGDIQTCASFENNDRQQYVAKNTVEIEDR